MINLMRRDEKFYDEIEQLGNSVADASKQLVKITRAFPRFENLTQRVERLNARPMRSGRKR